MSVNILACFALVAFFQCVQQQEIQRLEFRVPTPWNQGMMHHSVFGLVNPPFAPQVQIRPPLRPDLQQGQNPPSMIHSNGQPIIIGSEHRRIMDLNQHLGVDPRASTRIDDPNHVDNNHNPVNQHQQQQQQQQQQQHITKKKGCPNGCDIGYVCYGGGCQLQADSLCSPMCRDDYACDHGHCVYAPCHACPAGQICKNRRCVPIPCEPKCDEGQYCVAGQCTRDSSKAVCNPPCPPGYRCHSSRSSLGRSHCDLASKTPEEHFNDNHIPNDHHGHSNTGLSSPPRQQVHRNTESTRPHDGRRQPDPVTPQQTNCPRRCQHGFVCDNGICKPQREPSSVVLGVRTPEQVKPAGVQSRDSNHGQQTPTQNQGQGNIQTQGPTDPHHQQQPDGHHHQDHVADESCIPPCASVDVCVAGECLAASALKAQRNKQPKPTTTPKPNRRSASGNIQCGNILCNKSEYCFNGACIGIHTGDVRIS